MKKIKLETQGKITLKEGEELYFADCRQRNLRSATINHYRQSYLNINKFFGDDFLIEDFSILEYNRYVEYLRNTLENDISINSYLRDFITTVHFFQNNGYTPAFKMRSIKVDHSSVETYTEEELAKLLKKPNLKTCSFSEYQCWVMSNFLLATGVRQRSLINIKIEDCDLESKIITVKTTKNRKVLLIPINSTLATILAEYLKYRPYKSKEEYLFVNAYGEQFCKSTNYHVLYEYNKKRGVETTGLHRYRHTMAKLWVTNGGNVATLSRLLGHSNLAITQNYINLLVTDLGTQVEEINLLDKFQKTTIKMNRQKKEESRKVLSSFLFNKVSQLNQWYCFELISYECSGLLCPDFF